MVEPWGCIVDFMVHTYLIMQMKRTWNIWGTWDSNPGPMAFSPASMPTEPSGPVVAREALRRWRAWGQGFNPCLQHLHFSWIFFTDSISHKAWGPPYALKAPSLDLQEARSEGHHVMIHQKPSQRTSGNLGSQHGLVWFGPRSYYPHPQNYLQTGPILFSFSFIFLYLIFFTNIKINSFLLKNHKNNFSSNYI